MISTRMAEAALSNSCIMTVAERRCLDGWRSNVQAAIDEAWTTLDLDDPETYPQSECAPSGELWLIYRRGHISKWEQVVWRGHFTAIWRHKGLIYADPADIGPTQKGET